MSEPGQSEPQETARLHALVDGLVQGVGFRMFVLEYARVLGLTGWVRNTFDGRVEVVAEGPKDKLEFLVEKLRTGPRSAYVENLQKEWLPATSEFHYFDVR
jgi:acylphosphatase